MDPDAGQKEVMIIAGEASGDLHGSNLVTAMKKMDGAVNFFGIGGQSLKRSGTQIMVDASTISVVGITEVLPKVPAILRALSISKNLLKSRRPGLLILIDFPEFNLHIAGFAKKIGIPVLYYVSPQIWAWRSSRIRKIKQRVDHMAVILPFEAEFYKKYRVPVTFVGHPLLDISDSTANTKTEKKGRNRQHTIGLLPGSRSGEVTRHLPLMLQAAHIMKRSDKTLSFIISMAPTVDKTWVEETVKNYAGPASFEISAGGVQEVFERSLLVVAASGTVTLEAAIFGVPMIIIYKVSQISYRIGKLLAQVENVGLPNLIAGKNVVPELIQEDASPEKIAAAVKVKLDNADDLDITRNELIDIRDRLGGSGVSDRTAAIALRMINNS